MEITARLDARSAGYGVQAQCSCSESKNCRIADAHLTSLMVERLIEEQISLRTAHTSCTSTNLPVYARTSNRLL